MKIINIKEKDKFLTEYIELCDLEWGIISKENKKKNI